MFVNQQRRCGLECVGRRGRENKATKKKYTVRGVSSSSRHEVQVSDALRAYVCVCEKSVGGVDV